MRYIASAYAVDTRPEREEGKDAPKGGWRTKSGTRKLGNRATIEADSFGAAVHKAGELISALSDKAQKQVVRVRVEIDYTDPGQEGNPFAS